MDFISGLTSVAEGSTVLISVAVANCSALPFSASLACSFSAESSCTFSRYFKPSCCLELCPAITKGAAFDKPNVNKGIDTSINLATEAPKPDSTSLSTSIEAKSAAVNPDSFTLLPSSLKILPRSSSVTPSWRD